MSELLIILGSTRQNRQGEQVAKWVVRQCQKITSVSSTFIDLRDWPLPFYDEPLSPGAAKRNYQNQLGIRWCEKVATGDAFLIVTPEYNHGYPAVLKNALDWSYYEWNNKPVSFVSYSAGPAAGLRVVEQLRLVAVELQMVPLRTDVNIPFVTKAFDENGDLKEEALVKKLDKAVNELARWADALKEARPA